MSSLAAARADNFYHPPDWDPRKQSRAEHAAGPGAPKWKAHPLRERAKKLDQGILTIRFEMPFNVRCSGCDNHIAKGVRFNAEKKSIGKYLSTKILSFRMLCHCEDGTSRTDQRRNPHWIEIHTDPKNAEYVVAEGAIRVDDMSSLTADDLGVERTLDEDEAAKRAANPFYKLETGGAKQRKPWLTQLQEKRDADWEDDFAANRALRKAHRSLRKEALIEDATRESQGIRVPLLAEHPADVAKAHAVAFQAAKRRSHSAREQPKLEFMAGSIFGAGGYQQQPACQHARRPASTSSSSSQLKVAEAIGQEKLRDLQKRRERGMLITVGAPAASPAASGAQPPIGPLCAADAEKVASADALGLAEGVAMPEPPAAIPKVIAVPPLSGNKRNVAALVAYSDTDSDDEALDTALG
eukprot:CAMPEP_0174702066 /NCGR_PEP_ID=MMETSP1094-20130205/6482_1 /TAXON_ID=156173 /ORGANISM="Chrysochromulina brevifilum, Strain UTEX LB 985" /LENGTH=410 /DNA_ID=CAMNT_0015899793 /DNA_START=147 /DNA_END=1379 /DNA_ORIENTATION=-